MLKIKGGQEAEGNGKVPVLDRLFFVATWTLC